jgi:deoxyribonuclease IV
MTGLLFGTAGIPASTWPKTTSDGIRRVAALGLDCMELAFVHGVYLNEAEAKATTGVARNNGIRLSAHAPYFMNLNAHDPRKSRTGQGILHRAARIADLCGAANLVFHPGFYMGDPPAGVYKIIKTAMAEVLEKLTQEDNPITLRPEVSGKTTQFGTVDEVLRLTTDLAQVSPCIDFAHWHARGGAFNSFGEFNALLRDMEKTLGRAALDNMHIHVSGIEYGKGGERRHLPLQASDLHYEEILRALKEHNVQGMVICESPNPEEDALLLQETYHKMT